MHYYARKLGLVAMLLCVPRLAFAAIESEQIMQGVAAFRGLDFTRAITLIEEGLKDSLTREERITAFETLGFCHAAIGNDEEARKAFEKLLLINPAYELNRTISPRVRSVFEAARKNISTGVGTSSESLPTVTPTIEPSRRKEGQAVRVGAQYGGGVAHKARLFYRQRGKAIFSETTVSATNDRDFSVLIDGAQVAAPGMEYYLTLLDKYGTTVAQAGTLAAPLHFDVAPVPKPIYRRAWFWGLIGGIAAGGAVAAGVGVAVTNHNDSGKPAHLGFGSF